MITRHLGQPLDITVTYPSDPLVPYGYTYTDITDVSMCLKKNPKTDADDRYLQKTEMAGGVSRVNPNPPDDLRMSFVMALETTDWGQVTVGSYHLVLAVQVPGGGSWIELGMVDDEVAIIPDHHRT